MTSMTHEIMVTSMELVTITPAQAKRYLENSPDQFRRLDLKRVQRYAEDYLSGRWSVNGETVKFYPDGSVADGVHRLAACIKADVPLKTWICLNVTDTRAVDVGVSRKYAQLLKHRNVANHRDVASVASILWAYDNNMGLASNHHNRTTTVAMDDVLADHVKIGLFIARCLPARKICSVSKLAFVLYVGCEGDVDISMVSFVIDAIATGANLPATEPFLHFRELMKDIKKKQDMKMKEPSKLALLIKAWNFTCVGKPIKKLTWRGSGPNAETFPDILKWDPDNV